MSFESGIRACVGCGRFYNHEVLNACPKCAQQQPPAQFHGLQVDTNATQDSLIQHKTCVACAEVIKFDALLCKHCGTMQSDERFVAAKKEFVSEPSPILKVSPVSPPSPVLSATAHLCPKCGLADSVAKVAAIVDGGTSNSSSVSFMNQIGHPGHMYTGLSVGTSQTALAQRFAIGVPEAQFRYSSLLAGWIISTWLLCKLWFHESGTIFDVVVSAIFSIIPGAIIGLIIGFSVKKSENAKLVGHRARAFEAISELRSAYYCMRDDLVFKGNKNGSPEQFIAKLLGD